ncbi:MAG: hypothetical protein ACPGUD_03295 [Parashewanella sp.]
MPRITKLEDDIKSKVYSIEEYQKKFELMTTQLDESEIQNKSDYYQAIDAAKEVIELLYKRLK